MNANNWSTVLGGNWIPDYVVEAMNEVSKTFVDMFELVAKVDARIAQLCQVEDAHVASGAGAAIELAVAGCLAGNDFGKWMRLPNVEGINTGMMLGNGKGAAIIKAVRDHSFPHNGWGRGHKVSKEQIVGLCVALEEFVTRGDALYEKQRKIADHFVRELGQIDGLAVSIIPNDETYHEHVSMPHVPRVKIEWDKDTMGFSGADLDAYMRKEDPPVALRNIIYFDYYTDKAWRLIDTYYLRDEEVALIIERLKKIFSRTR